MVIGRKKIYTDVPEITSENIFNILSKAIGIHYENVERINFLLNYEAGEQPLKRKKTYRSDINCITDDNVANQITEFKTGFHWGNPITLIQNGEVGKEKAISKLNENFVLDNNFSKMQEIARFSEICGYGIEYIEVNNRYKKGKCPWTSIALDPRYSFIVYSNYYADRRKMMGVTYRVADDGNIYFTCITETRRFEILNMTKITNGDVNEKFKHLNRSGEINFLNMIPFVEWLRSYDRMGCFERQIPQMDTLNLMISDFANDVDQNTQCIWFGVDVEFPKDENGDSQSPKSNDWLLAYSTENGKPTLSPLSVNYDYQGILNNIVFTKNSILENAYVPQRNDNSGGSTGVAMSDATGWSGAEMIASKQQPLQEQAKMEEVEIILAIIENSALIESDNELKTLILSDVKPNVKRQKNYEIVSKTNALSVMINAGVYGEDAFKTVNLFDDPMEVWMHSKDIVNGIQKKMKDEQDTQSDNISLLGNPQKAGSDEVDQIENSPMLDGSSKSKVK